jgi:hypothetical protein
LTIRIVPNSVAGDQWSEKKGVRQTKPRLHTPNEAIFAAPNEAIGRIGKAPNEATARNEAVGKMGKAPNEAIESGPAPNEAISTRAERSRLVHPIPWCSGSVASVGPTEVGPIFRAEKDLSRLKSALPGDLCCSHHPIRDMSHEASGKMGNSPNEAIVGMGNLRKARCARRPFPRTKPIPIAPNEASSRSRPKHRDQAAGG